MQMQIVGDLSKLKQVARSPVFATSKKAFEFSAPYRDDPRYFVDMHFMPGVGTRVTVYETGRNLNASPRLTA